PRVGAGGRGGAVGRGDGPGAEPGGAPGADSGIRGRHDPPARRRQRGHARGRAGRPDDARQGPLQREAGPARAAAGDVTALRVESSLKQPSAWLLATSGALLYFWAPSLLAGQTPAGAGEVAGWVPLAVPPLLYVLLVAGVPRSSVLRRLAAVVV